MYAQIKQRINKKNHVSELNELGESTLGAPLKKSNEQSQEEIQEILIITTTF